MQRLLSAAIIAELTSDSYSEIAGNYGGDDARIVITAMACYLVWIIEDALKRNLGPDAMANAGDVCRIVR